jgi:SUMO ligase MMS21 Smc5/6 complex component
MINCILKKKRLCQQCPVALLPKYFPVVSWLCNLIPTSQAIERMGGGRRRKHVEMKESPKPVEV